MYIYPCVWCCLIVLNGKDLIAQDANGIHVITLYMCMYISTSCYTLCLLLIHMPPDCPCNFAQSVSH